MLYCCFVDKPRQSLPRVLIEQKRSSNMTSNSRVLQFNSESRCHESQSLDEAGPAKVLRSLPAARRIGTSDSEVITTLIAENWRWHLAFERTLDTIVYAIGQVVGQKIRGSELGHHQNGIYRLACYMVTSHQ